MKVENKIARTINIHKNSGDRTNEEKRIGNDYLNCDYEDVE